MKIEAGRFYRTRGGRKAFVLGVYPSDIAGGCAAGAVLDKDGDWECTGWFADGLVGGDGTEDADDLVGECLEPIKVHLVIVRDGDGGLAAISDLDPDAISRGIESDEIIIARKTVTLTEGEGMEAANA